MTQRTVRNRRERDALFEGDLAAVEFCVAEGRLDDVRRLVVGLEANVRASFPGEGSLDQLRRMGAIYWALGLPAMAGRYWFALDDAPPEADEAREEFERSCGGHPFTIQAALPAIARVRLNLPRIAALDERVKSLDEELISVQPRGLGRWLPLVGCALAAFFVLWVFMAGIMALAGRFDLK